MKAVVCTKYGPPDVLRIQEVDMPSPKEDEVLIKIHSAAVTTAGLISRKGEPRFARVVTGFSKPKNDILGMELAGEIVGLGSEVSSFAIGDNVFGLTGTDLGSNAEYICLSKESALTLKPERYSFVESAAMVEGGLTALNFLKNKGRIEEGHKVLINGASGSVGTAAVQLAKHFGAEVTGVCSSSNIDLVKSLGVDYVIDYNKEDFTENGEKYDIIFDTVGSRSFLECRESLVSDGIYLDADGIGTVFHMFWTSIFSKKKAILSATYMRSKKELRNDLLILKKLIDDGALKPVIDKVYGMDEIQQAHHYVEQGRKKGNVCVTIC